MAKLLNYTDTQQEKLDRLTAIGISYKMKIDSLEKETNRSYEDEVELKKLKALYKDNSAKITEVTEAQLKYDAILKEISRLWHEAIALRDEYGFKRFKESRQ